MTDPSTDRERLVEYAYKDSRPLLAAASIYHYQRDPVEIHPGCSDRSIGRTGRVRSTSAVVRVSISRSSARSHRRRTTSAWTCRSAWRPRRSVVADVARRRCAAACRSTDATFDVVIAAHMLYHVPDVDAAVREFARVLAPGRPRARRSERACTHAGHPTTPAPRRCAISSEATPSFPRGAPNESRSRPRRIRRRTVVRHRALRAGRRDVEVPVGAAGRRLRRQHASTSTHRSCRPTSRGHD